MSIKNRAYELADRALRKIDGVPSEKDQLQDPHARSVRAFIERSQSLWFTPTQIHYRMDGLFIWEVKDAIKRLKQNGEVLESAITDPVHLEAQFTTLKHYHDVKPLRDRIFDISLEVLGGGPCRRA